MVLRIVEAGNSLPHSWIVDPTSEFQPGQIGQLTVIGNQTMCTVSNGLAPLGVIDDIKTKAFTAAQWAEQVIVPVLNPTMLGGVLVTPIDIRSELQNPNIDSKSFTSTIDVQLIARNGVIVFPANTPLNVDLLGSGTPNAIKTTVNYTYQVPNIVGDDSTAGSHRITIWFQRMIAQTNMYETNQVYPINRNLFVSELGLLTTRQPSDKHPAVAIVTGQPNSQSPLLEFLWL